MKRKKIAALFMAVVMGCSLVGCGNAGSAGPGENIGSSTEERNTEENENGDQVEGERIPITIGGMHYPNSADMDYWPNEVVEYIEDKLNIELTIISYDNEAINLALASDNLADIVKIDLSVVDNVLKGNHALALDPYLETIGTNMAALNTRNEILREFKSNGTGNLYFRTPQTGVEDPLNGNGLAWSPYWVRWDLYKAIGMPEVYDGDTYIAALKQMYELYNETPDGLPVYGKGVHSSGGVKEWVSSWGMAAIGQIPIDSSAM